jgi:hypothetical protein
MNYENKSGIGKGFIIDEIMKQEDWIMKKKANITYGNQHAMIRRFNDEFDCSYDSQGEGVTVSLRAHKCTKERRT